MSKTFRIDSVPLAAAAALGMLAVRLLSAPAAPPPSGAIPTRIILTWSGDPATTQAVTWRTEVARQSPQVQCAKLAADPAFEKNATVAPGTAVTEDLGNGRSVNHYAGNIQGLDPDTKYCYRVGDGQVWSEWNVFRTAAAKPDAFRFIYVGDAQNSIKSLWSRTIRMAYATAPDARFMLHSGDLVAEGWDDRLWGEWSDALGFISAMVPSVPVPGNHDLHRPPVPPGGEKLAPALTVAPPWRWHFALPANGPQDLPGMESQSYYMDYQGVRFIVLDSNAFASEKANPEDGAHVREQELAWLNKVLSNNPSRWTIVAQHQCIYSIGHEDYPEMRAALAPVYEKYGVDLVLQGHDHIYARSHKVAGGKVVDPSAPGVIYATSVSGPKMYDARQLNHELMAKIIDHKQFFQVIDISPDRLQYRSYSVDGAVVDQFDLRKRGDHSTYVDGIASKAPR
jgi:Purple acid Phosphatase, N-terminal domain/Calcineurin-like phosphoesterase